MLGIKLDRTLLGKPSFIGSGILVFGFQDRILVTDYQGNKKFDFEPSVPFPDKYTFSQIQADNDEYCVVGNYLVVQREAFSGTENDFGDTEKVCFMYVIDISSGKLHGNVIEIASEWVSQYKMVAGGENTFFCRVLGVADGTDCVLQMDLTGKIVREIHLGQENTGEITSFNIKYDIERRVLWAAALDRPGYVKVFHVPKDLPVENGLIESAPRVVNASKEEPVHVSWGMSIGTLVSSGELVYSCPSGRFNQADKLATWDCSPGIDSSSGHYQTHDIGLPKNFYIHAVKAFGKTFVLVLAYEDIDSKWIIWLVSTKNWERVASFTIPMTPIGVYDESFTLKAVEEDRFFIERNVKILNQETDDFDWVTTTEIYTINPVFVVHYPSDNNESFWILSDGSIYKEGWFDPLDKSFTSTTELVVEPNSGVFRIRGQYIEISIDNYPLDVYNSDLKSYIGIMRELLPALVSELKYHPTDRSKDREAMVIRYRFDLLNDILSIGRNDIRVPNGVSDIIEAFTKKN